MSLSNGRVPHEQVSENILVFEACNDIGLKDNMIKI